MLKIKLKNWNIKFKLRDYLNKFLNRYCEIYSDDNNYCDLIQRHKNMISIEDFLLIQKAKQYSRIKHLVFYILSKITFGNLRKNFKEKRNIMRNLKNINIEFKY